MHWARAMHASMYVMSLCRLWNYATQKCAMKRQLADDALSIALHPTGLMLLTAFSDRVKLEFILRWTSPLQACG